MSNTKRYKYWVHEKGFKKINKILTSNIMDELEDYENVYLVSFTRLVKCGWEHLDNSTILLLRLLDMFELKNLAIAGLDGYSFNVGEKLNYVNQDLELFNVKENPLELNEEIKQMLDDFVKTRVQKYKISFITESRFSPVVNSYEKL